MTGPELLGAGLLGGIGAIARFGIDAGVSERIAGVCPFGTLIVNLVGSLVLGVLVGAGVGGASEKLVATGLIGGFTTFSTWMLESHRLGEDRHLPLGMLNIVLSLVFGVTAAWAGQHAGAALRTRTP
jgi:fluoride exporter